MRVIVYPEPQIRAPQYYRTGSERHTDAPRGVPTSHTWYPRPLQIPKVPPSWRYVWNPARDVVQDAPTQFTIFWQHESNYARSVRRFFRTSLLNTERDTNAPAGGPSESTVQPWRRPITYEPHPIPVWFTGNIGEDVPPADVQLDTKEQILRPLRQPAPPKTLYLFGPSVSGVSIPEPATHQQWSKPVTYKPYQPQAMLRQILHNLSNPEPGAQSESQQHWIPKTFRNQAPPPILRYLFNPAQDVHEEPGSQFQVFWAYQTGYEDRVRQFFLRNLQSGSKDGVSIPESPAFPGFVNRPIRLSQIPAIAKLLYQNNPAQDFDSTPEPATFESFVNRKLWPWMAPKGAYMYYRSGLAKDEPAPLPTPTGGGHLTAVYRRRMELLGIRLGISAG